MAKLYHLIQRKSVSMYVLVATMLVATGFGIYIVFFSHAGSCSGQLADFNDDCVVNILDLSFFVNRFGDIDDAADLNGDGRVDIFDLSIFVNKFGTVYTPTTSNALAMPAGGASGFGTAADFYDSFGVNVRSIYAGTFYNDYSTNPHYKNMLARLDEAGIRHIRDSTLGSWYDSRYYFQKPFLDALETRNASLSAGHQPIFTVAGTAPPSAGSLVNWTAAEWFKVFDGGHVHYNGDTGTNHCPSPPVGCVFIPGVGTSLTDAQWAYSDPEIPWTLIGAFQGPNEPQSNFSGIRAWMHDTFAQAKAHTTQTVQGNLPYVATDGIHTGAKVKNLPVIGPAIFTQFNAQFGDATGDNNYEMVDVGTMHPYRAGSIPTTDHFADEYNQKDPYNGDLRTPPDRSKGKPMFITEIGDVTDGTPNANAGVWPIPEDVQAEHTIRDFVLAYRFGIRRTYLFQLADSGDGAYGLVKANNTPKQSFYAVKNLLQTVGFQEAPAAAKKSIAVSVSGFIPGPNNLLTRTLTGAGTYDSNPDRLHTLLLQKDAKTYLYIVSRQVNISDREPCNTNSSGQPQKFANPAKCSFAASTKNLTLNLPSGVKSASIVTPTDGGTTDPNDGQTFTPLTLSGGDASFQIQGKTKVIKIVMN